MTTQPVPAARAGDQRFTGENERRILRRDPNPHLFRKATFLIHAEELAAARAPGSEAAGYLAAEWDLPMRLDEIRAQRDVFGDGRVVLVPLPGHTPGSIGALAQLDRSGTFLLAGDTISLRETLDTGIIPRNTWNADALSKSLDEVRRIEKSISRVLW